MQSEEGKYGSHPKDFTPSLMLTRADLASCSAATTTFVIREILKLPDRDEERGLWL